ncbi:Macro domain-containing protein [Balamuthia mandrillaris]
MHQTRVRLCSSSFPPAPSRCLFSFAVARRSTTSTTSFFSHHHLHHGGYQPHSRVTRQLSQFFPALKASAPQGEEDAKKKVAAAAEKDELNEKKDSIATTTITTTTTTTTSKPLPRSLSIPKSILRVPSPPPCKVASPSSSAAQEFVVPLHKAAAVEREKGGEAKEKGKENVEKEKEKEEDEQKRVSGQKRKQAPREEEEEAEEDRGKVVEQQMPPNKRRTLHRALSSPLLNVNDALLSKRKSVTKHLIAQHQQKLQQQRALVTESRKEEQAKKKQRGGEEEKGEAAEEEREDRSTSQLLREHRTQCGRILQVRHGDITGEAVDTIVNAANTHLAHGAGVAGAIMRSGGWKVQSESDEWVRKHGPVATGNVAVTGPGRMSNIRCIIHAVGPICFRSNKAEMVEKDAELRSAVLNSLLKATELGLRSIAIPAISSGIFGYPKPRCATMLFDTVAEFLKEHPESSLREVRFTNWDKPTVVIFMEEFDRRFGQTASSSSSSSNHKKEEQPKEKDKEEDSSSYKSSL